MDDPGRDICEVPEPRLIAPHVLVGLPRGTVAGVFPYGSVGIASRMWIGKLSGVFRTTDTMNSDN